VECVRCADVDEVDIGIVLAFGVRAVDCGVEVWGEVFRGKDWPFWRKEQPIA
jgi:hypothetical protein